MSGQCVVPELRQHASSEDAGVVEWPQSDRASERKRMIEELDVSRLPGVDLNLDLDPVVLEFERHVEPVDRGGTDHAGLRLMFGEAERPSSGARVLQSKPSREELDLDDVARGEPHETASRELRGQAGPGQRRLEAAQARDVFFQAAVARSGVFGMV